jgi:hypothetical protein
MASSAEPEAKRSPQEIQKLYKSFQTEVQQCIHEGDMTRAKGKLQLWLDASIKDRGPDDPYTIELESRVADCCLRLATDGHTLWLNYDMPLLEESKKLYLHVLEKTKDPEKDYDAKSLAIMRKLTLIYIYIKDVKKADVTGEISYNESVKLLGIDHADTLSSMHGYGFARVMSGNGNKILLECLERRTKLFGPNHADTLATAEIITFTSRITMIADISEVIFLSSVVLAVGLGLRFLYLWVKKK